MPGSGLELDNTQADSRSDITWGQALEVDTKIREDFTITEKAPTRAFTWLKAPTRHYAKHALTDCAFNQVEALAGAFSVIVKSPLTFV